ncbi:MAG: peptide transporter substrate-binding protein [Clostridiales bacterium]|jgi:peptide/nickel transport system substrate-binding protein|nr:peptide transporter substrate-binding protein [Clostridiales bacterium]
MKKLISLIMIIVTATTFTACGVKNLDEDPSKKTETQTVTATTEESPYVPTGEITIGIRNPETLNPILVKDKSVNNMLLLVFDTLFTLDAEQRPVGNLAESYTLDPSGSFITVTLSGDATWHDGTQVTADDVIFTIEQLKSAPADVLYKNYVANILRTSKIDNQNFTIYFNQPSNTNLYTLTFPIIPRAYYSNNMEITSETSLKPMGSGRFQFVDYSNMKQVNLIRNDEWFKTPAKIEKVKCLITKNDETDINSFHAGVIDISNPAVFNWSDFSSVDTIKPIEYTSNYYDFIGFNFNNVLLANKDIRKAIANTINREQINKDIYIEHNTVVDSPFHPDAWFSKNFNVIYKQDKALVDKFKTQAALTDTNDDKILEKDGVALKFELLVNSNDTTRVQAAELIKLQLKEAGIEITVNSVDYATYKTKLEAKEFDIFLGGWLLVPTPDFGFMFHSQNIVTTNYLSYNDPKMDSLLLAAYQSVKDDEVLKNYTNLHEYIQEEVPYFSLYFRNSAVVLGKNVSGDMFPSTYNLYNGFEQIVK